MAQNNAADHTSKRLFYHHVGVPGSIDFDKTVFKEVSTSILSQALSADQKRNEIIRQVNTLFPSRKFNCWGVPEGAKFVLDRLVEDDYVLLIQSIRFSDGKIPALCQVKYRLPTWQPKLSEVLWGKNKYPQIFLFTTEKLNLYWTEFQEQVKFEKKYDPRGKFYMVAESRLEHYGGVDAYIQYLRTNFLVE